MKPIRLTIHAQEQAKLRGALFDEIKTAIQRGQWEIVKKGRQMVKANFEFNDPWGERHDAIKGLFRNLTMLMGECFLDTNCTNNTNLIREICKIRVSFQPIWIIVFRKPP